MDALDLARWQFGITTVYHFLFVPLTLGLSMLVAGLQTAWYVTGRDAYLRATKFWGKLFLINFAMGVVTGIVQEFQFGMNWSEYSRFVGDIFGAPLAMEGLLAFFLESTFIGLWIFGWDRLPKKVHLATIWLTAIGTNISAYFILAANSWMQHPVGFSVTEGFKPLDPAGRAELTSIWAVLTNTTALVTFPHVMAAAFMTAGAFMAGIAVWHIARRQHEEVMRSSLRLGAWALLVAGVVVLITGDLQSRVMTDQQPMKMAAAEALWETQQEAGFSLFTIGTLDGAEEVFSIRIPGLTSFLATGRFGGTVEGINDIQADLEAMYGPADYRPNVAVTYWTFRLMIAFGAVAAAFGALALWATRRGRKPVSRWFVRAALLAVLFPLLGNTFGWIFTEMGRQPWAVYGLQLTANGVSLATSATEVLVSLVVLTVLYGVLAVIEVKLIMRTAKTGPPEISTAEADLAYESRDNDQPLTFAY